MCARAQVRVHGDAHMETLERVTFGGRLDRHPTFTAHPKKDPDTGTVARLPCFLDTKRGLAGMLGCMRAGHTLRPV